MLQTRIHSLELTFYKIVGFLTKCFEEIPLFGHILLWEIFILFHATFSSLNGWTCGRQQVTTTRSAVTENRVGRNAKDWWKKSRFLTASHSDSFKAYNFYFQSVIHGHLHIRVRDEGDGSRLRAHQVHLLAGRLELAGLHCDKLGVSYFRYFELFKHYKNIAYIFTFSTYEYVAEHKSGRHLFEHCYLLTYNIRTYNRSASARR